MRRTHSIRLARTVTIAALAAGLGSCAKKPDYASAGGSGGTGGGGGSTPAGTGGATGVPLPPPTVALTPPMGWNSWNKFAGNINDTLMRQTADAMVSSGMAAAGYQYLIIDDAWQASRDTAGTIVPDGVRFPDMKALADYIHGKGLKFGIYSDRGTFTCGGHPGSFGHEKEDAATYASWGVDYVKYDNCSPAATSQGIEQDYRAMGDALKATGRDIVFSLSAWWFYGWEPSVGNLWRTTTDIQDNWTSVMSLLNRNGGDTTRYKSCTTCPTASAGMCVVCTPAMPEAAYAVPGLAQFAGPGRWNDPDMLEVGNGGMSATEYRSHFSLWAMMAAPLIAGNDLRSMTDATRAILTNAEVIAVDQDPLGAQGMPVSASTTLEVWAKKLTGVDTFAVALLNRTEAAADITVTWDLLHLPATATVAVRDLWAAQDLGPMAGHYTATAVPPHGVVMLKVTGQP